MMGVDVCHNLSKHDYRCVLVIVAGRLKVLGNRNDGGYLETCVDYRLGQGEVENDCEYACQLF
jgi:hypothetical protein